jgi:hypothetical protein
MKQRVQQRQKRRGSRRYRWATPGWTSLRVQWRINRLAKKTKESERLAGSIEACQRLVNEGRRTLHSAYSHPRLASSEVDDSIMGRGEPEISCLRYGVRPRVSDDIRGGISATIIDMEVDVTFRSLDHHDVTSEDCSRSVVLHNVHLSCALARDSNSSSTTTASTHTICGIVPWGLCQDTRISVCC